MGQKCQYKHSCFDIAQFFLFLNHQLLSCIFNKTGFDPKVLRFFQNYLVRQKTQYVLISFFSSFFNIDVGVGQGLALFSILYTLYISLVFHILENCLNSLTIPISFLSFVNNSLLVAKNKFLTVLNFFFSIAIKLFSFS